MAKGNSTFIPVTNRMIYDSIQELKYDVATLKESAAKNRLLIGAIIGVGGVACLLLVAHITGIVLR